MGHHQIKEASTCYTTPSPGGLGLALHGHRHVQWHPLSMHHLGPVPQTATPLTPPSLLPPTHLVPLEPGAISADTLKVLEYLFSLGKVEVLFTAYRSKRLPKASECFQRTCGSCAWPAWPLRGWWQQFMEPAHHGAQDNVPTQTPPSGICLDKCSLSLSFFKIIVCLCHTNS